MLGALQRVSASFPQSFASATSSSLRRISSSKSISITLRATRLLRPVSKRPLHQSTRWQQYAAAQEIDDYPGATVLQPDGVMAKDVIPDQITKFADLSKYGLVHNNVTKAITRNMGLETMTEVQSATINQALKGTDIIAQAKTGTGKTIAFLLPVLQRILKADPSLSDRSGRLRAAASDIRALIVSPTRELAEQIGEEAKKLCYNTNVIVQTAVGGTQKNAMLRRTQQQGCHILVGTPGRLKDIFSDPYSGVEAPKLDVFVLDEADRLLDAGFWPEIEELQRYLPDPKAKDRQTLMFSATIPREVIQIVRGTLKKGYQFVQCVSDDEVPTIDRVPQKMVQVNAFENALPTLYELCQREIKNAEASNARPFKAIVFYPSTAEVTLAASVFQNMRNSDRRHPLHPARIIEIHSKLSQQQRTRAADTFKRAHSAILFSSDVTARGMDFPNVTHVIQVGQPSNRDTYVHRIGRTGRAGKEGEGWLILNSLEAGEARDRLRGLPITKDTSLAAAEVNMSAPAQLPANIASILTDIGQSLKTVDPTHMGKAYLSLLGIYQWFPRKQQLLDAMNSLARFGWGMDRPPMVPPGLALRLNLSKLSGLNVGVPSFDSSGRPPRSSFGGFSGRRDTGRSEGRDSFTYGDRGSGGYGGRSSSGYGDRSSGFGDRSSGRQNGRFGNSDRGSGFKPREPRW